MLVIALDTSTPVMTAGLVRVYDDQHPQLVAERSFEGAFSHAEQLMPMVRAVLVEAAITFADVSAIVVGLGPGPFTGLRVGIASAAALGDALDLPVYGVPSHDALADALRLDAAREGLPPAAFAVVTDARRREVYLSGYYASGDRAFGPEPVAPAGALDALEEAGIRPAFLAGAGVTLVPGDLPVRAAQTSVSVGLVAAARPPVHPTEPPAPLVPLYLRRPDATEPGARKSVLGR
ncbi:tRNA (adenosine(37)-N6)-threonylcarbamoyltransferase complex dimerization subunit type 1 TsaB [Nakamurella silvestris]|nr:tRNA (adenosine(37)-N6)-threonylcarbamoyltransferase complex dimerization subunit type 1 TsaB [Nakamurella silvestris]